MKRRQPEGCYKHQPCTTSLLHHVLLPITPPPQSLPPPPLIQLPPLSLPRPRQHPNPKPCFPHRFLFDRHCSLERRVPGRPRWYIPVRLQACVASILVPTGTVVATLVSPIGSYFNKSQQSSYLGTSYLLSVCCFTPLYGRLLRSPPSSCL